MMMAGTPLGPFASLTSFVAAFFSSSVNCAGATSAQQTNILIVQTLGTLLTATVSLWMVALFSGPALILALLISSIVMRIYTTWMMDYSKYSANCV